MSDEPFSHKRPITVQLKIEADSWEDVRHELDQFSLDILIEGSKGLNGVSAGYTSTNSYEVTLNEGMTGARYRELLREWHERVTAARRTKGTP